MHDHCDVMLDSPAWRFKMLNSAHRAAVDACLEHYGVRVFGQPFILLMLERGGEGGADAQRQLSERLRVSPATMTASLKALEKQGCIRRAPDPDDMRRKRIEITDKGREAAENCHKAFVSVDKAMYEGFSADELDTLSGFFERMTKNLRAMGQEGGKSL